MKNISIYLKKNLGLLCLLFGMQSAMAQFTVTGTISDDVGAMPGATVVEKGTTNGVITNFDGVYSITISNPKAAVLVFSYLGFTTQEVALNGRTSVSILMAPINNSLDEVVIIGYGTEKKSSITGAIAVVDVEETEKSLYTNITDRLQGRVAGVSVTTGGEPGSIGDIRIRGSIFFNNNNPLYVVDGAVMNSIQSIHPNDIESIQILKDASSASIYGSRAANGVVLITTKKGKEGKLSVKINSSSGFQQIARKIDVMNTQQWARVVSTAFETGGGTAPNYAINVPDIDTDWQREVYKTGIIRDLNANVSGGRENFNVFFGVNNTYQDGTVKGPVYDRVGVRLNSSFEILKGLTVGENLSFGRSRQRSTPEAGEGSLIRTVGANLPVIPVLDPTRRSGYGHGDNLNAPSYIANPIGAAALFNDITKTENIIGNVYVDYTIIDGLDYHFGLGIDNSTSDGKAWNKGGEIRTTAIFNSAMALTKGKRESTYLEHRLTYKKTLGKHSFSLMGAFNDQKDTGSETFITYDQSLAAFEDGIFEISAADPSAVPILGSYKSTEVVKSLLSRLTYNYDERYFLKASVRRDGYSGFLGDNRYGVFPSADIAWNIGNEPFFDVAAISKLKFRVNYGESGFNEAGGNPYFFQNNILKGVGGANYNLGPNSSPVTGATRDVALGNPNIKWSRLKEYNFGLDLELFNGKIAFNADYYYGNVIDLLADIPVPGTVGLSTPIYGNITVRLNAVDNQRQGWETSLTYRKRKGDFNFSISANASANNIVVDKVPQGFTGIVGNSITRVGKSRAQLYMLEYQGLYTAEDIAALPGGFKIFGNSPMEGDAKYTNINGDNIIDTKDRTVVGDVLPDVQFGLNITATYKNFDFTAFMSGLAGRNVYNSSVQFLESRFDVNYPSSYNPWIDGVGTDPRPQSSSDHGNYKPSSRFVEDGSYVKLRNLQIGYTVPLKTIDNLRVYLSAQNLFTWTNYNSNDPEFEGGFFNSGEDPGSYPTIRTIAFGLNLSL